MTDRSAVGREPDPGRRGAALRREVRRLAGSVLVVGLLGLPLAVSWAVTHTEVADQVGTTPVTLTLSSQGQSELRLGLAGTVFVPDSRGPLGVVATVEGPGDPGAGDGTDDGDLAGYVRPEMLELYAGLFHDPGTAVREYVARVEAALVRGLAISTVVVAVGGGLAAYALLRLLPLRPGPPARYARLRGGLAVLLALAMTTGLAVVQLRGSPGGRGPTEGRYALSALDGSLASGATTNSAVIRALLGGAISRVRALVERQEEQERAFRDAASTALGEQAEAMTGPREGEVAVLMQSDMHCNTTMIRLQGEVAVTLRERFGDDVPAVLAIAGDLTTNGTAAEGSCIRDEAAIAGADGEDGEVAAITGNHETDTSEEQMRAAGMTVLDGSVAEIGGIRVLGDGDPARSELFGAASRLRGDETQDDLGARLRGVAEDAGSEIGDRPGLVLVHEAYAAQAFLGVDSVAALLQEVEDDPADALTTPLDDDVPDVPAGAVLYGHWHRSVAPRVLWNDDGTWTLLMELDTSGGAVATPTVTRFSTPWSPPRQQASFPVLFLDEESGLVTGYQRYVFSVDAEVTVEPRVEVGGDLPSG